MLYFDIDKDFVGVASGTPLTGHFAFYFGLFLLCEFIFLLCIVLIKNNRFTKYSTYLLLVNGSNQVILQTLDFFRLQGNYTFIIGLLVILIVYSFLLQYKLSIKIVTVVNCCLLYSLFLESLLGDSTGEKISSAIGTIISSIIFITLGIFKFDILFKLHTLFVCFIISVALIELFTGLEVFTHNNKNITTLSVDFLVGVIVFVILSLFLFIN